MESQVDLRQYVQVLWRRWFIIATVTLLAVLVVGTYSVFVPPLYESSSLIRLSQHSAPEYASFASAALILTNQTYLNSALKNMGIKEEGCQLPILVRVAPTQDVSAIRLQVRCGDPRLARAIAEAISRDFVAKAAQRVQEQRAITKARLDAVESQVAELRPALLFSLDELRRQERSHPAATQEVSFTRSVVLQAVASLEGQYASLRNAQKDLASELLTLQPPALIDAPSFPLKPVSPRRLLSTALALVLGLMIGITLAVLMEYFSTSPVEGGMPSPATALRGRLSGSGAPKA